MRLLIKNARVVDPANQLDEVLDVLVDNGKISQVAKGISIDADKVIDATDRVAMPGLVDMHVHLREPGREDEETVATGTLAALKGGITSVLAMPNTQPSMDSPVEVKLLKDVIRNTAKTDVYIAGTITRSRQGKELSDYKGLFESGVKAISDDGSSVDDEELMLSALKGAKEIGLLVICHCEDKNLSEQGVVNKGFVSTKLGLRGISAESEYKRVQRDIELSKISGCHIHIAHVSCKESVYIIRKAKKEGIKVTAETAPHYFVLTDADTVGYDTNMKINPPLRSKEDVEAIKRALSEGIIDCIASDHAPHLKSEKEVEFEKAPFGTIGLETSLSLAITELVNKGVLSWLDLAKVMSLNPAKILGIDKGSFSVGHTADMIIVDPAKEWLVSEDKFLSKSKNSAFIGYKLKGVVEYAIYAGRIAFKI